eukprot:m.62374 g.62374  ORF g.62374 m.62374 type:complete len:238 (+) comp23140_c2_seq5:833-1546(+)
MRRALVSPRVSLALQTRCINLGFLNGNPFGSVQPLTTLCLSPPPHSQAATNRSRGIQSLWEGNTASSSNFVRSLSTAASKGSGRRQAKASWAQTRAAPVDEPPAASPSKLKAWFQNPLGEPPSPEMQEKKKKTGIMYMMKTYGLPFFIYSTSVYAVGLAGIFISLEAYGQTDELLATVHGVLKSYNWESTAKLLDDLDPQYGNAAAAVVLNEILQLPLVPVVIATTPAVAKFFRKTK